MISVKSESLMLNFYVMAVVPLQSYFILVPIFLLPFLFIAGSFGWTFTEYALHRWLFHRDPPTTSYFLITLHFLLHGQHHKVCLCFDLLA